MFDPQRNSSTRSLGSSAYLNRALSIRSNKGNSNPSSPATRRGFSFASLRGSVQPELSRKLYRVIKSTNNLISAHETAGKERGIIATQLSEWGEQTGDEAVSDVSDKVGVVLCEMGELEDAYAHNLDDARGILKTIRNTEKSVQPSRDSKAKIADEIQKLKMKEPENTKLVVLEQELVRSEAENLVAEAQLTNIVCLISEHEQQQKTTREKLKEAYEAEFAAVIERAEKQIILAKHGRRLLQLLDESPVSPGDPRKPYENASLSRQVLNDAEDELRDWEPNIDGAEPVRSFTKSVRESGESTDIKSSIETGVRPGDEEAMMSGAASNSAKQPEHAGREAITAS